MLQGTVDHYEILERLGRGGMGDVYKAFDTRLQRSVAIKALHSETVADARALARLRREALAAAAIDHPYLSNIHELLDHDNTLLIVMEYVEGETLAARLTRGSLPLLEALQFVKELAEGLGAAHAHGLVHRDVKPSNVMITRHHHVKLMDFGLAKVTARSDDETSAGLDVTVPGQIVGTPFYMSPEQAAGDPADMRSDVFSTGVVLYECLAGRLPFEGTTRTSYLTHLLAGEPQPLASTLPGVPLVVDGIVMRCLARDPAVRYQTAGDLATELGRAYDLVATGSMPAMPARRRFSRRLALAAGAAAVLIVVAARVAIAPIPRAKLPAPGPDRLEALVTWPTTERDSRISPDGAWLSFISNRDGEWRIWLRRNDGGDPQPIVTGTGTVVSHAWSPRGNELAAVVGRDGRAWLQVLPAFFGGTARTTVALPGTAERLRVVRWVDQRVYVETSGPSSLWRIDLPAGTANKLEAFSATPTQFARDFAIDAGGSRVAFSLNSDRREDLWTATLDGLNRSRVTDDQFADRHPLWMGPETLAFQSNRGGQVDLWQVGFDRNPPRQITFSSVIESPEDVAADGSMLTFQQHDERVNLWRIDTRSGALQQLTADTLNDAWPAVATASRTIAFQRAKPSVESVYSFQNAAVHVAVLQPGGLESVRRVADGYGAALSSDGRWLAYVRPSSTTVTELWVTDLTTQQSRLVSDQCLTPGFYEYPFGRSSTHVVWRASPAELVFAGRDSTVGFALWRWSPSAWASEPTSMIAGHGAGPPILGLVTDGSRLGVLTRHGETRAERISVIQLNESGTSQIMAPQTGLDRWLTLLGFRPRSGGLVILHDPDRNDETPTVQILEVGPHQTRRLGSISDMVRGSARFVAEADTLYLTRTEGLTHNLHAFDLGRGALRRLTANELPGVTFGGFESGGPDALIFSRQEVKRDTWLIRFKR